jgi:hypothetical protein
MDSVATLSLALQQQLGSGPALTARGAWAIGTAYVANDVVTRSGGTYVNILANTGSDPSTDGGVHWALTATPGGASMNTAILALADALTSSANAYAVSVQARRVGLLYGVLNPQVLLPMGGNVRVETIAAAFNEVFTANQFLARANSLSQQVAPLRATDSTGRPAAALLANIPVSGIVAWANALISAATDFEALELTTLPA